MHKKRRNAGFSRVELLLAVAIVVTLAGFAFVAVAQQRKNLAILEADETAKEIFLAAQEHLSMAALQGRFHPAGDGDSSLLGLRIGGMDNLGVKVRDDAGNAVTYAVFDDKSAAAAPRSGDDAAAQTLSTRAVSSASSVMLPQGAIDEFVLNHRYAVRYSAETYQVLEVFYTADQYLFGEVWEDLDTWEEGFQQIQDNPGNFRIEGIPETKNQ